MSNIVGNRGQLRVSWGRTNPEEHEVDLQVDADNSDVEYTHDQARSLSSLVWLLYTLSAVSINQMIWHNMVYTVVEQHTDKKRVD